VRKNYDDIINELVPDRFAAFDPKAPAEELGQSEDSEYALYRQDNIIWKLPLDNVVNGTFADVEQIDDAEFERLKHNLKMAENFTPYEDTNQYEAVCEQCGHEIDLPEGRDFYRGACPACGGKMSVQPSQNKVAQQGDEPQDDDYFIEDYPSGGYGVSSGQKFLGKFNDYDEAVQIIREDSAGNNWYPNVWLVDDHGGMESIGKDVFAIMKSEEDEPIDIDEMDTYQKGELGDDTVNVFSDVDKKTADDDQMLQEYDSEFGWIEEDSKHEHDERRDESPSSDKPDEMIVGKQPWQEHNYYEGDEKS